MIKIYQKTFPSSKNAGFTLIELLVVVLIIGILAAVALPQYEKTVEKSRAAEALAFLASLQRAMEVYILANGSFTNNLEDLDVSIPANSYYRYQSHDGGLFAWHPKTGLYFEFRISSSWKGAQFCVARQNNKKMNDLCKSFGDGKVHHANSVDIYYKLN